MTKGIRFVRPPFVERSNAAPAGDGDDTAATTHLPRVGHIQYMSKRPKIIISYITGGIIQNTYTCFKLFNPFTRQARKHLGRCIATY
jgi:hypothetical protein